MKREFEYIVLGLGGLGSAAVYWLARRAGGEVLGLERFELGHDRGGSQDHSRIIRLSYHTPGYVRLARDAYDAWAAVEEEAGERLVLRTGGLDLEPPGGAIDLDGYARALDAEGVEYEWLDAGEVARRWPPFRPGDGTRGLFQADGGIAMAARGNAAHARLAAERGAVLREGEPVRAVRPLDGEVEVATDVATYRCRRLVMAAGAWSADLLAGLGLRLPLAVTQEQVTWFRPSDPEAFAPERFPVWIWMDEPCFYGIPTLGEAGPKVGQDAGGREVTAETRSFDPDEDALERVRAFLGRVLPSALGPPIRTKTCLYTLTPDRDFVLDAVPGAPEVLVAIGAGHAYKFASALGRILADLAVDGTTERDLSPFRIDREILRRADPPRRYMV